MAEVETKVEPTTPTTPKTIVIQTTKPPLIPNENATAYCFTRRNIFDAIIALAIAGAIIYFVMGMRSGQSYSPFGSSTMRTTSSGMSGMRTGMSGMTGMSGIGQQIAGAIKKFFK